ncbi:glutathione S-transferase family protein [soil metagenome]
MVLIGVNRSPYTRRVAITLAAYGVAYEQRCVSGFGNREEVRKHNPLGRIPALVLDDGEVLIDSGAIVDFLDERYGGDLPTVPKAGAERRAVLRAAAIMMGACDKGLQAAYHRNHTPVEKLHQPWVDDCMSQVRAALSAVEAMVDPTAPYLMLGRLTQADIASFVAERLARFGLNVDTAAETPRLHAHARKLAEEAVFRSTEP